ncbi:hypothetical protein [Brevibacterium casei]
MAAAKNQTENLPQKYEDETRHPRYRGSRCCAPHLIHGEEGMFYYICTSFDKSRRINQKDEMNFLKKLANGVAIAVVVSVASATAVSASEQQPQVYGGWSEEQGEVYSSSSSENPIVAFASGVKHTGKAEEKTIKGTTNKRSHGWTTWKGVKHYTTARLERYWPNKGVITSSGRMG